MNSKLFGIIALVLVLAGAGWFFFMRGGAGPMSVGGEYSSSNPFTGTLKAAVELGVPMKCTYEVEGVEYEGVVQGEKYRGVVVTSEGVGNVIMKDDCMYTWSEGVSEGVKMCSVEEEQDMWADTGDSDTTGQANLPDTLKCFPTTVSAGEFNPPSNVNFMDFDALMQGSGAY